MNIKQTVQQIASYVQTHRARTGLVLGAVLIVLVSTVVAFWPRTIQFVYAGDNCVKQFSLLPRLLNVSENATYAMSLQDELRVFSYPIAAGKVCVEAKQSPGSSPESLSVSPFGGFFAAKHYTVVPSTLPQANLSPLDSPVPATRPLRLTMSASDTLHTYKLTNKEASSTCTMKENALQCDTVPLKLRQGEAEELQLERYYEQKKVATLASRTVTVLPAVRVSTSSIQSGQIVYDTPEDITITLDKSLASAKATLKLKAADAETNIESDTKIQADTVTITPKEPLKHPAEYILQLAEVEAVDGSGLYEPYDVAFKMSDGPLLTRVNIGATGAGLSQMVVLTFDQELSGEQDVQKIVAVTGVDARISRQKNQVIVQYAGAGRCTDFKITIQKGLLSNHGIATQEVQAFSSRTVCHTIQTIGYSHEGRPINAYIFGNGAKRLLFTGAIHGSEKSSKYILDSFVANLEARAREIPADKQVIVVPMASPDGVAKYGRFNARNVNLNRNWPTANWKKDDPGHENVGGTAPLSEPETQALARFTQQLGPVFVASYHSQGRIVNSNDVGQSVALGQGYARSVGYRFVPDSQTEAVFGATITGTYEDWLKERGIACILMELDTNTGNFFRSHQAPMWALIRNT